MSRHQSATQHSDSLSTPASPPERRRRWAPFTAFFLGAACIALVLLPPTAPTGRAPGAPQAARVDGVHSEGKDLRPSEYFHLQRAYPGSDIPHQARLRGFAQAAAKRSEARSPQAAWEPAGPTNIGGRITAIGYHSPTPLTLYAGCADGGVFKSTDLGNSWTPLFDDQNTLSIGAIAVHPNDPDQVLVGTGEANTSGDSYAGTGIYRSTDGGGSWTQLGLENSRHIGRIVHDPQRPDTLYVAALGALYSTNPERGVYRSFDGGDSWQQVLAISDSTACVDVAINPVDTDVVYAAMWERIRRPHDRRVGGPTSGIWRSTDHGDSWQLLTNGLPPAGPTVGRIGLAVAPSAPEVVYAIYADHPGYFAGIYKSTDGGDAWMRVQDGGLSSMYSSFGWFFGNIRVHPDDPDRVYALGLDTHRSTNGGDSWTTITNSIHVDQHDLVINALDSNILIAGNDGGIYISINGGSTWTKAVELPVTQFYAITLDFQFPERLYGGTQDNSTMRTLTGALNDWEIILGGDGFYTIVDPIDNSYVYAEYQYGGLHRSTNGGSFFQSATSGIASSDRRNWSTPVVMDPNDNQTLYYGTYRVHRSTNRAASWSPISGDLTNGPGDGSLNFGTLTSIAVAPTNSQVILVGADDSNVSITTNGGQSWTNVSASLPGRWCTRVAFDPTNAAIAYATFSGYRNDEDTPYVFRTTDFGTTWSDLTGDLPRVPVNVILVDPGQTQTLYVGTDAGTYVTYDLGGSWAPLGSGLPNGVVNDMVLHDPTRILLAGTHGRSMWKLDLGATTGMEVASAPAQPLRLEPPRPNPFRGSTRFVVSQPEAGQASLVVFDVSGRRVATLHLGLLPAGTHAFDWDGRDSRGRQAAHGVYLVRFEHAGGTNVQKVVLEP